MPNIKELADKVSEELKQGGYKQWTDDLEKIKAVLDMVIGAAQRIKQGVSKDDWAGLQWQFYGLCKRIIGIRETEDYHKFIHYVSEELGL